MAESHLLSHFEHGTQVFVVGHTSDRFGTPALVTSDAEEHHSTATPASCCLQPQHDVGWTSGDGLMRCVMGVGFVEHGVVDNLLSNKRK